eukprot:TRINITY_DN1924_c0_g3_i4.p1 TRINITY_DN1924_c0_g3~~TRINITY_DN1924_c0_g3_i4.p1  ORF type:complete len:580 (+),score=117.59 TRINITY_DN1924_c0_g3_i4:63-1802(+)
MSRLDVVSRERIVSSASSSFSAQTQVSISDRNLKMHSNFKYSAISDGGALSPTGKSDGASTNRSTANVRQTRKPPPPNALLSATKAAMGRVLQKDTFEETLLHKSDTQDKFSALHLKRMQDLVYRMRRKCDEQEAAHQTLLQETREMETKVADEQRIATDLRQRNKHVEKRTVQALEDKIDTLKRQYEKNQLENENLKETLQNVNTENRKITANVERTLQEIQQLSREKESFIERLATISSAYQMSEQELVGMYKHFETEKDRWCEEMKALQKYVENDRKVKELIHNRTIGLDYALDQGSTGKQSPSPVGGSRTGTPHEKPSEQRVRPMRRVEIIERAFQRIQQITQVDDIDEAVNKFINAEEVNNSLLNQNNELIVESERVKREVDRLGREIHEFKTHGANSQSAINRRLISLEQKLNESLAAKDRMIQGQAKSHQLLASIKAGVLNISKRLGKGSMMDLGSAIADEDLMGILGQLEEKIIELQMKDGFLHNVSVTSPTPDSIPTIGLPLSQKQLGNSFNTLGRDSPLLAGSTSSRTHESNMPVTNRGPSPSPPEQVLIPFQPCSYELSPSFDSCLST